MNLKDKRKCILAVFLLAVLLVTSGFYIAYRLHPELFIGQNDIITRGEFAAELAKELKLDTAGSKKDTPSFSDIDGHCAFLCISRNAHPKHTAYDGRKRKRLRC